MEKYKWEVGATYTTKEMQGRLGVSEGTWSHKRNQLLDNFNQYYDYEVLYKGRNTFYHILKQKGEYSKPLRKNDGRKRDEIYSQEIVKVIKKDNVQTAKNVSRIIRNNEPIVKLNHKDGTVYENTRLRMRAMFGTDLISGGTIGAIIDKIWCGLDLETNTYFRMSDEEYDDFKKMMRVEQKEILDEELELYSDYKNGLIEEDELGKKAKEIGFRAFLSAQETYKKKYGYRPIKVPVYGFYDIDVLQFERVA